MKPKIKFYHNAYLQLDKGEWIITPSPGDTKVLARFPREQEELAKAFLWLIQGYE